LKLYERGQLNWSDFRERTENSYVDRNVAIQLRFSPNRDVFFAFGIRHFSQTRYRYDDVIGKTLDAYYRSIGPTCSIVWSPGSHSQIALHGWYENRLQSDGSLRGLATMTLMLHLML
jgi:hypothetical protein